MTLSGHEYLGQINVTSSGIECQVWSRESKKKYLFPDKEESSIGNYCRNPKSTTSGEMKREPWCYTARFTNSTEEEWEYCSIPKCGKYLKRFLFCTPYIILDHSLYSSGPFLIQLWTRGV